MRIITIVVALLMLPAAWVHAVPDEQALCAVCVLNGETEPEKIVASRDHNGTVWHFCSEKCADAFDLQPAAYVFTPGPAPRAHFVGLTGDSITIAMPGRVTLVDFWATWCKPCVKSMPELDALYREFRGQGLVAVGIAIDTGKDREKKVRKFVEKCGARYPVAIDREHDAAWEAYRVKVLPTIFLIDGEGTIVRRWTGVVDMNDVRASVEALLQGRKPGESG